MNVLLSGHGADRASLDHARRATAYKRLVLLSATPEAPDLRELEEDEKLAAVRVEVHAVPTGDLSACLETAVRVLRTFGHDHVRVHVAGGPNLVTSALLLAAFQEGKEAFYCHARGISRLPVALTVRLDDLLTPSERTILLAMTEGKPNDISRIAEDRLSLSSVKAGLLKLRAKGLVAADHRTARLQASGSYYRRHLQPKEAGA